MAITFSSHVDYAVGPAPQFITSGDLNSDGVLDLVVADRDAGYVSVLLGNVNGTFLAPTNYSTGSNLLMPYGDVVIVLSTVLRIKRTLDGAEIDKIIWEFEAQKARRLAQVRVGGGALSRPMSRRCHDPATVCRDEVIG